jgi:hypothetical protein
MVVVVLAAWAVHVALLFLLVFPGRRHGCSWRVELGSTRFLRQGNSLRQSPGGLWAFLEVRHETDAGIPATAAGLGKALKTTQNRPISR